MHSGRRWRRARRRRRARRSRRGSREARSRFILAQGDAASDNETGGAKETEQQRERVRVTVAGQLVVLRELGVDRGVGAGTCSTAGGARLPNMALTGQQPNQLVAIRNELAARERLKRELWGL